MIDPLPSYCRQTACMYSFFVCFSSTIMDLTVRVLERLKIFSLSLSTTDKVLGGIFLYLLATLIHRTIFPEYSHIPVLPGPKRESLLWGYQLVVQRHQDPASWFRKWRSQFGPVFKVPMCLGQEFVVLCDPKAIQHFYAKDTYGYLNLMLSKEFLDVAVSLPHGFPNLAGIMLISVLLIW
jgi:hypothetical protein